MIMGRIFETIPSSVSTKFNSESNDTHNSFQKFEKIELYREMPIVSEKNLSQRT